MGQLLQDIRYGIRMLAKNPGFTLVAVLTLALGIGANTAIFSVINAELLRPLPYRDSAGLIRLFETNSRNGWRSGSATYPNFADWRAQNKAFENVAAFTDTTYTFTGEEQAAHLEAETVSADTFAMLGIAPRLGRTFLPEEDAAHHHVAILSDRLWKQRFGGAPGIIGRTISLNQSAYTVVGVMPAGFEFPLRRRPVDLWTTFSAMQETSDGSQPMTMERGAHFVQVMARLKPRVSLAQAQAGMDVVAQALAQQYPDTNKNWGIRLVPEQQELTGAIRPALLVMAVAVGFVLLIACVNVANLLLARATTRTREIAIRAALGAGRTRVVLQLLTESFLLALMAGTFGVILAAWGTDLLVRLSPEGLPRATEIHLDVRVMVFTIALSLLTGILFGLAPAIQVTHANIVDSLKEGSLSTTAGSYRHRLRSSLVIVEMALALILLVSAGLLIRSLMRLENVNPGFDPHNVMASDVDFPDQKYPIARQSEFVRVLLSKLKALPGAESVAGVYPLDMSDSEFRLSFVIEGKPVAKSEEKESSVRFVTPGYFHAMRIPLLKGRDFTAQDDLDSTPVVIVNQALAEQVFPGEDPIGKHIRLGISVDNKPSRMREIVGIVGNVKVEDLKSEWTPESYGPYMQLPIGTITILARAANNPQNLAKPIAETIRSLDKDLPLYNVKTVEEYVDGTIAIPRFNTVLLGIFAGLAMVLTAVGLYGVIAYSVAQRTHEIGVRIALGAQPSDMMRLVVGEGLRLALVGVGLGLFGAFVLTRFLASMLFGVTSADPVSYVGVVFLLLGIVFLACYIPARRAMHVDPMVALRYE
jgi:predicted permease